MRKVANRVYLATAVGGAGGGAAILTMGPVGAAPIGPGAEGVAPAAKGEAVVGGVPAAADSWDSFC